MMGELPAAREHLEQAIALYDPERHGSTAFTFGQDLGVAVLSHLVWVLWLLGYPDQASRRQAEALALARRVGHKNTLRFALMYSAMAGAYGNNAGLAAEHSASLLELAREQKFDLWRAGATVVKGWAIARQGRGEAGIAAIERGLAEWTSSGAEWMRPLFLSLLADACALSGDVRRALDLVGEALTAVERTGQCWPAAELHRLQGQFLTALPNGARPAEASAALQRAIQIARSQSAKSWELRAATSLARLWRDEGKHADACDLLAPVYAGFTEGFATPDLKEAKATLDTLRVNRVHASPPPAICGLLARRRSSAVSPGHGRGERKDSLGRFPSTQASTRTRRHIRTCGLCAPGQGSQSARRITSVSTSPRTGCSKPCGIVPTTSNPR
ncbi:hypothetical protein BQ8482_120004 [Mesorhizobium delmotii]|uniref:MalT-like TPR region domain-containing protein n=1 Tax=Mesorhizobium delmotii TaxID=1631247 RepID=A0A2P9AFR2_9HYPH|nr:hypothetical protein BQ8482_120004 [Mesorhizobium delmotii]